MTDAAMHFLVSFGMTITFSISAIIELTRWMRDDFDRFIEFPFLRDVKDRLGSYIIYTGAGIAAMIGFAKEVVDLMEDSTVLMDSICDFSFDLIGIVMATILLALLDGFLEFYVFAERGGKDGKG